MTAEIAHDELDGSPSIVLTVGDLSATIVPTVGMVVASLKHSGTEVLGQRGGLAAYRDHGSSFGIPLLYPWANRLSGVTYKVGSVAVDLHPTAMPLRLDEHGLPIHGLLIASSRWQVTGTTCTKHFAAITAAIEFGAYPDLMAGFPFPHRLELTHELDANGLRTTLVVIAEENLPVPLAFGFHPYLAPGGDRSTWRIELPVRTHAVLNERGLPTGEIERAEEGWRELGTDTYDDLYHSLAAPAIFRVETPERLIEVSFGDAYRCAQVYAPADADFICFEPMTAPTNALITGDDLREVTPGSTFAASFEIRIRSR